MTLRVCSSEIARPGYRPACCKQRSTNKAIVNKQTPPQLGAALRHVSLSIRCNVESLRAYAFLCRLLVAMANMTSFTKPEVHNI